MAGNKTHEQQMRIIEKRENTANAGKDFDTRGDLKRSPEARRAFRKGAGLKRPPEEEMTDPDDRNILRGEHQESPHTKRRVDD